MAINRALRYRRYRKGKRNCMPRLPDSAEMGFSRGAEGDGAGISLGDLERVWRKELQDNFLVWQKYFSQPFTCKDPHPLFKRYFSDCSKIDQHEYDRFRSCVSGCGKIYYGACKQDSCTVCSDGTQDFSECPSKQKACCLCAPGKDCFTTIIAVANSAIQKLSQVTPLAKSRLLYRGLPVCACIAPSTAALAPNRLCVAFFFFRHSGDTQTCALQASTLARL